MLGNKMKTSDEVGSPVFLKKHSHILTSNFGSHFPSTPTTRYLMDKQIQMHRSHFHSQATTSKFIENPLIESLEIERYSTDKDKPSQSDVSSNKNQNQHRGFDSFIHSDEISSSQQSKSHTKSHKKLRFGQYPFKESQALKKVKSNHGDGTYLIINSKKQKVNNNYLFLSNLDALKKQINKYQASIEKLKQENLKLIQQKKKYAISNCFIYLRETSFQLEALKIKIKQLQTEKQMHLTIGNSNNLSSTGSQVSRSIQLKTKQTKLKSQNLVKNSNSNESENKFIPTFRNQQQNQINIVKQLNSPRQKLEPSTQNYRVLQNMKSPYFLKKN